MKKKTMKLSDKQIAELWGEDGPYSEVHITRESRVLDDEISREFYSVVLKINPTTVKVLKKEKLRSDKKYIKNLLSLAEYKSWEEGYIVVLYNRQNIDESVEIEAYKVYREAQTLVCELHSIMMETIGLKDVKEKRINENRENYKRMTDRKEE